MTICGNGDCVGVGSDLRPRVGVIVVTHRSAGVLPGCLEALRAQEPHAYVAIVDSASPDGPPDVGGVPLIALLDNVGFGAAVNAGVAHLPDDWDVVFALNPDVRLHGPSLREIAAALHARPEIGVATGPVVDTDGVRAPSAWGPTSPLRALWFASGLQLPRLRRWVGRLASGGALTSSASLASDDVLVDGHVLGGAMAITRACWEAVGGFDEDYFLYWEDADLCQRARDAGFEVRVLPCTPIEHIGGASSEGIADERRWEWYLDGARTFARKHLDEQEGRRLLAALRWGRRLRR